MTGNLSSVLDLDGLSDGLVYKDISKVDFLLSKVSLRSKSFTFEFQGEPLFSAWNVAVCHAVISACSDRYKSYCDCDFRIGPDLSDKWFNSENFILEKEQIIFNCFSDGLIFSCKWKFSSFSLSIQIFTLIKLLLRWRIVTHVVFLFLISLWGVDHLSQEHELFCFFLLKLLVKKFLFRFFLFFWGESSPFEWDLNVGLVHDVECLLGLQSDVTFFHGDDSSGEINVGELTSSYQLNVGHKFIVLKFGGTSVEFSLQGVKLNNNLLVFSWLQDSFPLIGVESLRKL